MPTRPFSQMGSPPRGRGKVAVNQCFDQALRITPALAGKSLFCFTAAVPIQDHPRMGGEKTFASRSIICMKGSPPRRRGIVVHKLNGRIIPGITPAWAGKSSAQPRSGPPGQDHPRVGGEKISMSSTVFFWQGSPPRGRGKVHCNGAEGVGRGITPALAGKRGKCGVKLAVVKDHPRMGGEK